MPSTCCKQLGLLCSPKLACGAGKTWWISHLRVTIFERECAGKLYDGFYVLPANTLAQCRMYALRVELIAALTSHIPKTIARGISRRIAHSPPKTTPSPRRPSRHRYRFRCDDGEGGGGRCAHVLPSVILSRRCAPGSRPSLRCWMIFCFKRCMCNAWLPWAELADAGLDGGGMLFSFLTMSGCILAAFLKVKPIYER